VAGKSVRFELLSSISESNAETSVLACSHIRSNPVDEVNDISVDSGEPGLCTGVRPPGNDAKEVSRLVFVGVANQRTARVSLMMVRDRRTVDS
jgi:hypothetical protein